MYTSEVTFLCCSHAWKSGLAAFFALVIRWIVSPALRSRTSTAIRSVGSKFWSMYSEADRESGFDSKNEFMAVPARLKRSRRSHTHPCLGRSRLFQQPHRHTACRAAVRV